LIACRHVESNVTFRECIGKPPLHHVGGQYPLRLCFQLPFIACGIDRASRADGSCAVEKSATRTRLLWRVSDTVTDELGHDMSYLKAACQHCKGHIEYPSELAGQSVECPHCKQTLTLPPPPIPPPLAVINIARANFEGF
jgi:hypothetical protein